jgi:hypothetical protein
VVKFFNGGMCGSDAAESCATHGRKGEPRLVRLASRDAWADASVKSVLRSLRIGRGAAISLVICGAAWSADGSGRLYVDSAGGSGGNGTSWQESIPGLTTALAIAAATNSGVTEIWIAAGTYRPDEGGGDVDRSFVLVPGVKVYGGFAGTESTLGERNAAKNVVTLSGDIGVPVFPGDNSRHVVVVPSGAGPDTVLDGVTIVGGNATGTGFPNDSGGGMMIDGGSPTIRYVIFRGNLAKFGAGLFSRPGSPVIEGCEFLQNIATNDGGGMNVNGDARVRGSLFDANKAAFGGAAVFCCGDSSVADSVFSGNFANTGGAVFSPIGRLSVARCRFDGNTAQNGGAINSSSAGGDVAIASSAFVSNTANAGGALHLTNAPTVFNSVFSKNASIQRGAAFYTQGNTRIVNCTVYSNWSLTQGGGIYAASGKPVITNTILWGNADTQSSTQASQMTSAGNQFAINHSCVQGWTGSFGGVGNVSGWPLFADADGADERLGTLDDAFRLLAGSSCIDAGDAGAIPADSWDIDGDGNTTEPAGLDYEAHPRVVDDPDTVNSGPGSGPHVDIGAVERQPLCRADFDGSGFLDGDDFDTFVLAFEQGVGAADYDISGFVDGDDFDLFVGEFMAGC